MKVLNARFSFTAIVTLLLLTSSTFAHDPGLSTADILVSTDEVVVTLAFAPRDLTTLLADDVVDRAAFDRDEIDAGSLDTARTALENLAADAVSIESGGMGLTPHSVSIGADDDRSVTLIARFERGPTATTVLTSTMLARLPRGHRQYATVRDVAGGLIAEALLDTGRDTIEWKRSPAPAETIDTGNVAETSRAVTTSTPRGATHGSAFGSFVMLGIEHILIGYDHLIFLFGLLIVGGRFGRIAGVITAFTVAHSITLALATFDLVSIPSHLVEAFIAASIVYVGIENLVRRDLERRWRLAFVFGLVHGLGFASVLDELGVHTAGQTGWLLAGFNLGVELGQIAIAACVLPLVWRLARSPRSAWRVATVGSWCTVCAGGFWLIERTM